MSATTLGQLKAAQQSLLLKPLDAAVFLAPWYTPAPTAFTDVNANLQPLPAGYQSVGLIDKRGGVSFTRGITSAPIESYGELQATRNDITSDLTTLEFEPQQSPSAMNLQLTTSVNLAQVQAAANGEVLFAQPADEQIKYYSAIVIGKDGSDAAPIYVYKIMPKVAVSKYAGEQWNPTALTSQRMSLVAFKDENAGYAVAHGFGGAGWQALLSQTGISYTVTAITVAPTTLTLTHASTPSAPLVVKDNFGGIIPNSAVNFTPSSGGVASVTTAGVVQGLIAGAATITASYTPPGQSALTAACTVTVN